MTTNNREISWLNFNERVLQEVNDESNPPIERIRFLGIFSNNRDEFFKVRIATLRRMLLLADKNSEEQSILENELEEILLCLDIQGIIYNNSFINVFNELKSHNILLKNEKQLDRTQQTFIEEYYKEHVHQSIFPIILDNFNASQMLNDSIIYMAVNLSSKAENKKDEHLLIEVPKFIPRFLKLETNDNNIELIFIEDVIRHNLPFIFSKYNYEKATGYIIKFTKDSEITIDNDVSKSFLEIMSESVKKRHKGIPVRFIYDGNIPNGLLSKIIKKLNITTKNYQTKSGGRYHNFKDLMKFPALKSDLLFDPMPALTHCQLTPNKLVFSQLRQGDVLLNFPYHSFHHVIDFLREASLDSKVRSIKMTFYRAAVDSMAMNALINAARNGKKVTVFMELQARFDERANIKWTQILQSEGITVLPTLPGVKVHSKVILVRRKQAGENFYYTNISTGNFNESTAKFYSDFSLMTANQDIGKDASSFFELLETRYVAPKMKALHISPYNLRDFLEKKIKTEIANKKKGKDAWIVLKINNLADQKITDLLYKASQKGVKIELNVRGINIMKTGVKGLSENVNSFSIVGRFLEHSRAFIFANGGDTEVFISSADIMARNLDYRFEMVCPIYDEKIKNDILNILALQRNDTEKYRSLNEDQLNKYVRKNADFTKLNSQEAIYEYWQNKDK